MSAHGYDFENPTFDPDGPGIDDDYSLDLPDAIMGPLTPRVQEERNTSGDNIQSMRGEIREAELEAQKKRLVDTFYKEVNRAYGLRPMTSSGSMPTARRSIGRLARKRS